MSRLNIKAELPKFYTAEGGRASSTLAVFEHEKNLERLVANCLLWEDTFYQSGSATANEVSRLCKLVKPEFIAGLAIKARKKWKLRHIPLFLLVELVSASRDGVYNAKEVIAKVISRPDEMGELLKLYLKQNNITSTNQSFGAKILRRIPAQLRKGLAAAFGKFDEYQFAKWDRSTEIKIRDVMFLTHPKPDSPEKELLYENIAKDTLATPETREVMLSSGKGAKETYTDLLQREKLGYMALLMNIKTMVDTGVDYNLIKSSLMAGAKYSKALPFRFITAANHCPRMAAELSDAMLISLENQTMLKGKTVILVDVSGSMGGHPYYGQNKVTLSDKSQVLRLEAASALAILAREVVDGEVIVYSFSDYLKQVDNYRGLPLMKAIKDSQPNNGTMLAKTLTEAKRQHPTIDRLIVITDEQSQDGIIPGWANGNRNYLLNVGVNTNGLSTSGGWQRISGFSEAVIHWMVAHEDVDARVWDNYKEIALVEAK